MTSLRELHQTLENEIIRNIQVLVQETGVLLQMSNNKRIAFAPLIKPYLFKGRDITHISSTLALCKDGTALDMKDILESNHLRYLVILIDKHIATLKDDVDNKAQHITIRGYETEDDLDAQRSTHIDSITIEQWENGEGVKLIEENEPNFYHIEQIDDDGKLRY